MKGGIPPMLHLGLWIVDVEVDKGAAVNGCGPGAVIRHGFKLA